MLEIRNQARLLIEACNRNPGWRLLASRRAPLVIGCLQALFAQSQDGVDMEAAQQALTELLSEYANDETFGIGDAYATEARKELREWIRRRLVIEREGRLYATDALEKALDFVTGLEGRMMTSTASRLSVVQREIENLDVNLNPDARLRGEHLRRKLRDLERELARVEAGDVPVLDEAQAVEAIREVYNLAAGLSADFRRVEDSYRAADRSLREAIVGHRSNRGQILDELLSGHENLLQTSEGQVFHGFFEQLKSEATMGATRERLRNIIEHPYCRKALDETQRRALRWLFVHLNQESQTVLRARERSEQDVRGYLKMGLVEEHHRVGELLEALQAAALELPWEQHALRTTKSCLPPAMVDSPNLPLIERLRCKSSEEGEAQALELDPRQTNLNDIEDDFWLSFDSLDQQALLRDTRQALRERDDGLTLAQLADRLPPTHDLETLAFWLSMARQAEAPVLENRETIELADRDEPTQGWRFHVPKVVMTHTAIEAVDWESES